MTDTALVRSGSSAVSIAVLARPPVLAGVLALLCLGINLLVPSMGDQPWMLHVARQMLAGQQMYVDLIETNPPLWFWSGMPVVWLADRTGIDGWILLLVCVHLQALVCVWLWDVLTRDRLEPVARLVGLAAVVCACTLVPVAETGQRENFTLMGTIAWCALAAARLDARVVPWPVALLAGLMAAYGFALKHWFVLVPVAVEIALAVRLRWRWRPLRIETLVLAAGAVGYGAAVLLATPEFFTRIVPLVDLAYAGFGPTAAMPKPELFTWLVIQFAWLGVVAAGLVVMRERRPVMWLLLGAAVLLAAAAVVQQKGFRYHALPAQGLGVVIVALMLASARTGVARRRLAAMLVAMAAVFVVLPAGVSLRFDGREIERDFREPAATLRAGERLAVIDMQPENAFLLPMAVNGGVHLSRHYSGWMMPGLLIPVDDPARDTRRRAELARVLDEFREDLMCRPADMVILENSRVEPPDGRVFANDMHALLRADSQFRAWFDSHYRRAPQWKTWVWRLAGPRPPDRPCR